MLMFHFILKKSHLEQSRKQRVLVHITRFPF